MIGGAVALFAVAGVGTVVALPRGDAATVSAAAPARPAAADGRPQRPAARRWLPRHAAAPAAQRSADRAWCERRRGRRRRAAVPARAAGRARAAARAAAQHAGGAVVPPGAARPGPRRSGPGTTTCADRQDPALRALLVQVLPEAASAPAAATTDVCLPGSERYVSLELGGGVLHGGLPAAGHRRRASPRARAAPRRRRAAR